MREAILNLELPFKILTIAVWKASESPDLATTIESVNELFKKEWKPQTVSTFLSRLVQKNYLIKQRKGRYWYYTPLISSKDHFAAEYNRLEKLNAILNNNN